MVSWALYDWANSAFATTVMAGFFPVFYSALTEDLDTGESQFWFNMALATSSLLIAVAAPLLGAIADNGGRRKKYLATFAMLGIVMTAGMAWVHSGMWWVGLLLYGCGAIGFSGANIFYDAMIVEVSETDDLDIVSAYGYSLGYIGGGLLFAVNVLMVTRPEWFGLADAGAAVAASFLSVAVWWALFSLPLLINVKEEPPRHDAPLGTLVREGLAQLKSTFGEIRKLRVLFLFLVAYWLYIDGVGTIIKMAVFFGDRILGLPREALITSLLLTQFVAFPAALFFGWLGKRIGPRRAILIGLAVYLGVVIYAWRWLDSGGGFYGLAVAIGLVQGGVQSLSRSLFARMAPRSMVTEFFGFFNMVGKFAAILGPLLMALMPIVLPFTDERDSILALTLLFVAGGILLYRVDVDAGVRAAREIDESRR